MTDILLIIIMCLLLAMAGGGLYIYFKAKKLKETLEERAKEVVINTAKDVSRTAINKVKTKSTGPK